MWRLRERKVSAQADTTAARYGGKRSRDTKSVGGRQTRGLRIQIGGEPQLCLGSKDGAWKEGGEVRWRREGKAPPMLGKMTTFENKLHLQPQTEALASCVCCVTNPPRCHSTFTATFARPGGSVRRCSNLENKTAVN